MPTPAWAVFAIADAGERDKVDTFRQEHDQKHGRDTTAAGGRYTYAFTPTALGITTVVTCSCGESLDVTDYDSW